MRLILASQSPRRHEILSFFAIPFEQIFPHFDEEAIPYHGNPKEYAEQLSGGKAKFLVSQHVDTLILAADTVVECEGKLYGKPNDLNENIAMLESLCGKWHSVITAVTCRVNEKEKTATATTRVLFQKLTKKEIEIYCKSLHTADKAAGYAIQGAGGLIVEKIDGCYYNVMGLPLNALRIVLEPFGINLWEHLQ